MNVKELSKEQIDELKSVYFYDVENDYTYIHEVPDEVIFNHYADITFTDDDFCCTAHRENGDCNMEVTNLRTHVQTRIHKSKDDPYYNESFCNLVIEYLGGNGEFSEDDVAFLNENEYSVTDFREDDKKMTMTIRVALADDSIDFDTFFNALNDKGIGDWDSINSTDIIHDYINDMMRQDVSVRHILEALETEDCSTDQWHIWLGNSMETPEPINTKQDLVDALDISEEDMDTIEIEVEA